VRPENKMVVVVTAVVVVVKNQSSIPGRGAFSFLHNIQTGSGAHPASYPMGARGSFPGHKAAEA
jgi:hypothetical protein